MGLPERIAVEAEMRFPWRGGRHPWLDAAVTTATTLVGIESKRYEPFRPGKAGSFSEVYGSREWGAGLAGFDGVRRALQDGRLAYRALDAVQLVKHAYGLATQAGKQARGAVLVYLHAAPDHWSNGRPVDPAAVARHRAEITDFAARVAGDVVTFVPVTWADLLAQWSGVPALAEHAKAIGQRFGPL